MSGSGSSFLRGAIQPDDGTQVAEFVVRWLHNNETEHPNHGNDEFAENSAFFIFAVIVVGFIGLSCLYCVCHMVMLVCCGPPNRTVADLVTDDFSFSLNSRQRRAILEAIFSDTSKAVTDSMFFKDKKASAMDVMEKEEIPNDTTDIQTDADSVDLEANADALALTPIPVAVTALIMTPDDVLARGMHSACTAQTEQTLSAESEQGISAQDYTQEVRRSAPWQQSADGAKTDKDLRIPPLAEESKDEEEELQLPKLAPSPKVAHSVSCSKDESKVGDDEENVCAICLSGYNEGETVISSKYCNHLFHKDCILQWLDKHDECPCCRVDMVTSGDVSKATATIVGRTRMIKAVEPIRVRSQPASPHPRSPRGVSPRARFGSR